MYDYGNDPGEEAAVRRARQDALAHISRARWIRHVVSVNLAARVDSSLFAFLVTFEPVGIDEHRVWVFAGELPVEYVEYDSSYAATVEQATDVYLDVISDWSERVERGEQLTGPLVEIVAPPTAATARRYLDLIAEIRRGRGE